MESLTSHSVEESPDDNWEVEEHGLEGEDERNPLVVSDLVSLLQSRRVVVLSNQVLPVEWSLSFVLCERDKKRVLHVAVV